MHCKQARKQIVMLARPTEALPELKQHTAKCEPCAQLLEGRAELHNALARLRAETEALGPSDSVEEHVLAALNATSPRPRPRAWRWITVAALGLAALLIAAVVFTLSHTRKAEPIAANTHDEPFTAMPYVVPPAPYERTSVIRTQVSLQIMQSAGFQVHDDDLGSTTLADVLYGEDGRILALRLVSQPNPASDKRID